MVKINTSTIYFILNFIFLLLYIVSYFNSNFHEYLDILNEVYKAFISFVLIYFFNPWSKKMYINLIKKLDLVLDYYYY